MNFAYSIADTADETQIPSDPFNPRNPRLLFSSAKNCQGEKGDQNTEQWTRDGKHVPA
jgi:hypothetical protein